MDNVREIVHSIFYYHKFPFDNNFVLNLAKQKEKSFIVKNAIAALKHLKSKEIREFAIEQINHSKNTLDFLPILISNYKKGDFKLLVNIAKKARNEYKIEQLADVFVEIYRNNKTKECGEPLEILYSKMNCAIHRKEVIEILIKNNVLSDKIHSEIQYDCNLETRELYEKY